MRIRLSAQDLREIVREEIASSIEVHRASRLSEESYVSPKGEPTDDEIDDFLISNQLLDIDLVQNLVDSGLLGFAAKIASIRVQDLEDIRNNILEWASTNSWLGADLDFSNYFSSQFEITETDIWYPSKQISEPVWLGKTPGALLIAGDLLKKGKLLSEMDWREFEKLIATLLEKEGWLVELTKGSKDGGIDIIASLDDPLHGNIKSIWQAKRYSLSNKVSLSSVRELSAIQHDVKATKAMIVTTSHLTRGALNWIRRDQYRLGYKQQKDIENWVKKYL